MRGDQTWGQFGDNFGPAVPVIKDLRHSLSMTCRLF